ncbi:MAG TPA: ABC transporter ATP-binding protein [Bryobacteraceae bacterium]|nr:ABC transporter ATP-binding protein [Bryobacteraceae bacterium]
MIRATQLTRRFDRVVAVDGLDLEIPKGEVFGLVGPDGAGKTTTLRLLTGLLDPDKGEAEVAGFRVAEKPDEVRDRIGYMAQKFGLYGDLTVEENMDFYADLFGVESADLEPLKQKLLAMTRMAPFRARPAGKLSGGMKQKLALMCTLLHKPEILLLDEPTNGVDPVSRRDFWVILEELVAGGMTLLVTTAYLDEAERCHRVGLMHNGRMIRIGTPTALKAQVPGVCYEVTEADLRALRRTLAARPEVHSVKPAGAALHVFLAEGAPIPDVGGRWERIQPTLEDVFVSVIGGVS